MHCCFYTIVLYCIVFVTLCCSSVTLRAVRALQFQIPVHDLFFILLMSAIVFFITFLRFLLLMLYVDMISPHCVCVGNMSVSVYSKSSPPSCVVMPAKRGLQLFSKGQDSLWRHQLCRVFVYLQMPMCLWGINVVGGNLQRICGLCELVCKHVCLTASQVAHS